MTSFWEILKSSKNLKASDAFAELWGKSIADSRDIITITGTLPLTFEAKGEALKNYRLHGTSEGSGVQTSGTEPAGYKIPLTDTGENLWQYTKGLEVGYLNTNGTVTQSANWRVSPFIDISGATKVYIFNNNNSGQAPSICFYDSELQIISGETYSGRHNFSVIVPANTKYCKICVFVDNYYEFVLTTHAQTYHLYIGDSKLGAEEYVDYAEQKVWKMVDGTLTPTDPPVPLPEITAYKGENTLSSTETVGEVSVTGKIKEI